MKRFEVGKQYKIWPMENSQGDPRINVICFRIEEDDDCWFVIMNEKDELSYDRGYDDSSIVRVVLLHQSHYDKRCGQ